VSRNLAAAFASLGEDEAAWGGEEDTGDQALGFEREGGVADGFEVGAGVVQEDEAGGADLGQEAFDLGLADGHVGVGEEDVDGAFDVHLERGFVAELDELGQAGGGDFFLGFGEDDGVELAGDDLAEAVGAHAFGHP